MGDGGGGAGATSCADLSCDPHATCDEDAEEPTCECNEGFEGDGESCADIDECAADDVDCPEGAVCANRDGGYVCVCPGGLAEPGSACGMAVDECAGEENTCDPNATCTDTVDGFACECEAAFSGDGYGCGDVDECADSGLFSCPDGAACRNTFGGYACDCGPGFVDDGSGGCESLCDVALADTNVCDANGLCHVDDGVASCGACAAGYSGDGQTCVDDSDASFQCPEECDGVNAGQSGDAAHAVCRGDTCECAPGYTGDPATDSCVDVDECATASCGDNSTCVELPAGGGYVCACDEGYELDAGVCVDKNECADSPCHPNATCQNTEGGFTCTCAAGYTGDGAVCSDVNECMLGDDDCADDGTEVCVNTAGGFRCRCAYGYARQDSNAACENLDECADPGLNACSAEAECTDTTPEEDPLGYVCRCPDGLSGDGFSCEDVNECNNASLNDCGEFATCIDELGGYRCECSPPFAGNDPSACYCDLSGYWALRQDVDICWDSRGIDTVEAIRAGHMEASAWELHKYTYDGDKIVVEKKGCGADNTPDFVSPRDFFDETYSSRVPDEFSYDFALQPGSDINEAGLVPGDMFITPSEASVLGIDLGDDLLGATWPGTRGQINPLGGDPPAWDDVDGDGYPGLMVWPLTPEDRTDPDDNGVRGRYSYLPVDWDADLNVTARAGCVSLATRVVNHLEVDVDTCTRMVGTVISESAEGRVAQCWRVDESLWNPGSGRVECGPDDLDNMTPCEQSDLDVLDEQDQSQRTTATFEMIKVGELDETATCEDVRQALPAIVRTTETVTCND